jgi:primosomal protein N' (replication factor Y) (superfamily II helicase)
VPDRRQRPAPADGGLFDSAADPTGPLIARVLPDVSGLDKHFDYRVPAAMAAQVRVGTMVRVQLHGRRVGGWVVRVGPPSSDTPVERLLPIAKVSGEGPSADLVELAMWAAQRWGSPRVANLLTAASPRTMVPVRPVVMFTAANADGPTPSVRVVTTGVMTDPLRLLLAAADGAADGQLLVIHPAAAAARALASRLRRAGRVALLPDDWAQATAGNVDVVVGGRSAVWGPCRRLRAIVVLDEHDEALQEERSPTWHARDVAIERARRANAECVLVSPCPTATGVYVAAVNGGVVEPASLAEQTRGWPIVEVVDRNDVEPWKRSLLTSELIRHLRSDTRVLCVINTTGRARLLACRSCRAVQRCERCDAAVALNDDDQLACARCATVRPQVCQQCGSGALANIKPGVSRLREELEAAAGRPVAAITAAVGDGQASPDGQCNVFVGTEAALHRVRDIDVVAFLDPDAELFAPRYRANEQMLALLVRAARLAGGRRAPARLLVQTNVPDNEMWRAVQRADISHLVEHELARRRLLGLPPHGALALVSGPGAGSFIAATGLASAPRASGDDVLVRATDWSVLGAALSVTPRPKGSRLRVEVDPARA